MDMQNVRMQRLEEIMVGTVTAPSGPPPRDGTVDAVHESIPPKDKHDEANSVRRPKSRLPDPSKFGGDRSEWTAWKTTMENKLLLDAEAIGDSTALFLYIYSRLDGNAWKSVTTYVRQNRESGQPVDFLRYLEQLYGDPNARDRAATRLHKLRQGDGQAFARFLPIFEREMADAGALDWPDDAKRPILLGALNRSLRGKLANRGIPQAFPEIINRLHEISNDMDALSIGDRPSSARSGKYSSPIIDIVSYDDPMDIDPPASTVSRATAAVNPSGFKSGRPGDIPLYGQQAKWVTREEIERRKTEGWCLRCGRDRCRVRICPLLPARPPPHTMTKRSVITEAAVEDTSLDNTEQAGNA
jgi:hypothetical protein